MTKKPSEATHGEDHGSPSANMGLSPNMTEHTHYQHLNGSGRPKPRRSLSEWFDELKWVLGILVLGGWLALPATRFQLDDLRKDMTAQAALSDEKTTGRLAIISQSLQNTRDDAADIKEQMKALTADVNELLRRVPERKAGARGAPSPSSSQAVRWRSPPHQQKTNVLGF